MIALCVDDEQILLKFLVKTVSKSPDVEKAHGFLSPLDALEFVSKNKIDVAFLDIELCTMNGIELAKKILELCPSCAIVFCTGFANYAIDAINNVHVSGYLLKPIDIKSVQHEIDRIKETIVKKKTITVDLSHGIEVLDYNGNAVHFKRKKTEELLSFLIKADGESVAVRTLCEKLWGDCDDSYIFEKNRQYLTQLLSDLRRTLDSLGITDVVKKTNNGYAAIISSIVFKK